MLDLNDKNYRSILKQGETDKLEFKLNFSKSVVSTLGAFANTKGGCVLVGVSDTKNDTINDTVNDTVKRDMEKLKKQGFVVRKGSSKKGYWKLVKKGGF